jgi:hypothetical protein
MTATVKLNIGSCSEDERAIRHDFLLNDKIVDLLSIGYPDFTIMDAVDIGVANEGFPILRKLGLVVMGKNPIAVDQVGARLLGFKLEDVPYLHRAVERGYLPARLDQIKIMGDLKGLDDVAEAAKRIMPYDDEFYRWTDVNKELRRLKSPMSFYWGPYGDNNEKCLTGCAMGIKMFFACFELYSGAEALAKAKPAVFVIGKPEEEIDAKGNDVILLGSCAKPKLKNARKVIKIDKCFCTVSDMMMRVGGRTGLPNPLLDQNFVLPILRGVLGAALKKTITGRYAQDIGYFMSRRLDRRI